ncbi:MAG TPA: fibronectin type III domain-containing protein [Candidatus Angelobacter sp.]|nr:fibronectin type III domain-containing protein [Candidatus Angelobacter sp.]
MKKLTRIIVLSLLVSSLVHGQESRQMVTAETMRPWLPKIIQNPVVLGTGDRWAVISWTTNAAGRASSVLYAGTDKNNLRPMEQTREPVRMSDLPSYEEQEYTHLVRLDNLKPGTLYYFVVDPGTGDELGKNSILQLTTKGTEYGNKPQFK